MFDQEQYRRAVLDPAIQDGNTLPADLFVRYGFDPAHPPRSDEFAVQVEAIARYWQSLTQRRAYRVLAEILIAAHKALKQAGRLTPAYFTGERDRRRAESAGKLKEAVEDLAAGGSVVAASTVAAMAARLGGAQVEADLREQLRRRRVRVIDEVWPLPTAAPARSTGIRNSRKVLGVELSIAVVAGEDVVRNGFTLRHGLRLGGKPLTEAMLRTAKERAERQPQDERKTATDSVLAIVRALLAAGSLQDLVLWELMEAVRPAAELPMTSVLRVAREAAALGLDRDEAAEFALAVLMRREGGGDARRSPVGEVEDLLGAGSLRAAERLLATVPAAEAGDLVDRVRAVAQRVADLAGRAQREISEGRAEHAAELLTAAVREAADDDDLAGRLRALAPPAVPAVRAGATGARVTIGWTPSPARTGNITYQVVRTRGRAAGSATDGDVVGRTDGNEIADTAPPAGDDLHYSVFASRTDGAWSPGAAAAPVTLLPEVAGATVTADDTSVRATWTVRPDAARISVVREPGGVPVASANRAGFTEQGLRAGQEYRYLVRVGYPGRGGAIVSSPGLTLTVTPQPAPRAVLDLAVEPAAGQAADLLRLVWTPPRTGDVVLRSAPHRSRWQPGAELTATELAGYGAEVAGRRERAALTTPLPSGRVFITAFSVGGDRVICGPTVALTSTAPVTGLRARRVGPAVRLSWDWPDGVALARIRWWPVTGEQTPAPEHAEQIDCWLRSYRDDGGAQITTGIGPVQVSVATVSRDGEQESISLPALVRVPAAGIPVRYLFVEKGVPFRRTTQIVLSCDQPCLLPDLVVVQLPGRVAPLRPDQGTAVARVPAQRLEPGRPVEVIVPILPAKGPYRLGCFVDDRAAGSGVVLMGTPGGR
jgi:hypothetical protein